MSITISNPIKLHTEFGDVFVRHLLHQEGGDAKGEIYIKEGIVVTHTLNPAVPTLVRLQSSCLFGEALWATDCDCGPQLRLALKKIIAANGLLVYLYEEGRGAGLRRKIQALELQQTLGFETDHAFSCLNMESDLRTYRAASDAIKSMIGSGSPIVLLSNNPAKKAGLIRHGVSVSEMRPLIPKGLQPHTLAELRKKRERLQHIIPEEELQKNRI